MGSVVCPGADLKIFLTASLPERRPPPARRPGGPRRSSMDPERVLEDVRRRDLADSTRAASPLRIAEGAVVIDSSEMDADEVADFIVRLVEDVRAGAGAPPA